MLKKEVLAIVGFLIVKGKIYPINSLTVIILIIKHLKDCDGLMWHWTLNDYKSVLFARQLFMSLEKRGINIFPDIYTSWQYDDKLGQKYLFEAINAPFINTYIFYSKADALKWIETSTFPKVFKLRGGSSSVNVSLV